MFVWNHFAMSARPLSLEALKDLNLRVWKMSEKYTRKAYVLLCHAYRDQVQGNEAF